MAFPVQDTSIDHVRTLIAQASQADHGLEAMHFAQAALNAAQALGQLAFEQREQENHDRFIKEHANTGTGPAPTASA